MDLRKFELPKRKKLQKIGFGELFHCYKTLTFSLNEYYKAESSKTYFEEIMYDLIRENTKLDIYRSFWIGKRNFDLFIPSIKGERDLLADNKKRLKGLVIEVDGKIHDSYSKMRRDESKFDSLHKLEIGCCVIENQDTSHPNIKAILDQIPKLKRLDSRAKKRLMRNIYIKTILSNSSFINKNNLLRVKGLLERLQEAI